AVPRRPWSGSGRGGAETGRPGAETQRHQETPLTSRRPGIVVTEAHPDIFDRDVPLMEGRAAASLPRIRRRLSFLGRRGGGPSRWRGAPTGGRGAVAGVDLLRCPPATRLSGGRGSGRASTGMVQSRPIWAAPPDTGMSHVGFRWVITPKMK